MFRSLVCVAITMFLLGGEMVAAVPPQASTIDCRLAEHRPKRLRRLGNRFGAKHPAPQTKSDDVMPTSDDQPSPPPVAHDPVRLDVTSGWSGSASTSVDLADQSAAALFPAQAPVSQTE